MRARLAWHSMPDEQAAVVVILASDDASYVTDQMINCHSAP